ncbi:nuclear transport factor 2 family protein [Dickeya sp. ws52]|uniref:nuclear transport factor 2 family protein n=1 Tax=Dickeya sp. ws52 TaxID=2576377 RepID=UPI00118168A2|nr:nuclear transport factor 2 family protein [Dickeya sp. ws52]TYL43389.1 nuclear transport factor 2 family protein [Dickeya sp. ws52]
MSTLRTVFDDVAGFYAGLDTQPLERLSALYHPNALLVDPFGQHQGLPAIQRYFAHLLENTAQCYFTVDDPVCDTHRFAMSWTMHWSHPRIAGGKPLSLSGCSIVEVQQTHITHQRDFYDAGEMIYEHLPVLGWAVRHVKRRVCA